MIDEPSSISVLIKMISEPQTGMKPARLQILRIEFDERSSIILKFKFDFFCVSVLNFFVFS